MHDYCHSYGLCHSSHLIRHDLLEFRVESEKNGENIPITNMKVKSCILFHHFEGRAAFDLFSLSNCVSFDNCANFDVYETTRLYFVNSLVIIYFFFFHLCAKNEY